jgi:hypothetical protein
MLNDETLAKLEAEIKEIIENSFRSIYATGRIDDEQLSRINKTSRKLQLKLGHDILADFYLKDYYPFFDALKKAHMPNALANLTENEVNRETVLKLYQKFKEVEKRFED